MRILRKRADGYHDLETCFYPLPFFDVLEIISAPKRNTISAIDFHTSGLALNTDSNNNICVKAIQLLKERFPDRIPALKVHLHKNIPAGAGLGGGSANGAFTITLLNKLYHLGLSVTDMAALALQLGSDCPFFIHNTPSFASGRGEMMEPVSLDLSIYHLVLINPGIHISTAAAFQDITPALPDISLKDIVASPPASWKEQLYNDFEKPVFRRYPEIQTIKEELYAKGAIYAAMSGTGSTVYGLFAASISLSSFSFPTHYFIKKFDSLPPGPFSLQ